MKHVPSLFVVLIATLCSTPIYAERIYRYLDEDGGVTYTNYPLQYYSLLLLLLATVQKSSM